MGLCSPTTNERDFDILLDTTAAEEMYHVACASDGLANVVFIPTASAIRILAKLISFGSETHHSTLLKTLPDLYSKVSKMLLHRKVVIP